MKGLHFRQLYAILHSLLRQCQCQCHCQRQCQVLCDCQRLFFTQCQCQNVICLKTTDIKQLLLYRWICFLAIFSSNQINAHVGFIFHIRVFFFIAGISIPDSTLCLNKLHRRLTCSTVHGRLISSVTEEQ